MTMAMAMAMAIINLNDKFQYSFFFAQHSPSFQTQETYNLHCVPVVETTAIFLFFLELLANFSFYNNKILYPIHQFQWAVATKTNL